MKNATQHRSRILQIKRLGFLTLAVLSALLMVARPAQAQTEAVLYNFTGTSSQSGLTFDSFGNLYGTTQDVGASGAGTVLELSPNGSGGWNETTLHTFTGGVDGAYPNGSLIFDSVGNIYGTAAGGGANGGGVVFKLSPAGGGWTETILYNFCSQSGCTDGFNPRRGLIFDSAGNLYGTTYSRLFELSLTGGGWTEKVIYTTADDLIGSMSIDAGNIFVVVSAGRSKGYIVEFSPSGDGWNATVIQEFPKDFPGHGPSGPLVFDKAGNLYGITAAGYPRPENTSYATVYKLSPTKKGKWLKKTLYIGDGAVGDPFAGLAIDSSGNVYVVETGSDFSGSIFELKVPNYAERTLWNFNGTDGENPLGSLILDNTGNLYGTTTDGGSNGDGVVFEVTPSATATTTALTSVPNPSTYRQAVTFTAIVTPAPPNGEAVSFMEGTMVLGTGSLTSGSASFTTSALPIGTTTVTALYGGDSHFSGSPSNTVAQVVAQAPYGVVSPMTLNFDQIVVGQTSPAKLVSLKNTGNSLLTISSISISEDFAITINHCANGVQPATHCNVSVTFTPQGSGTETGSLTFTDNASNSPQTVSLTGTGTN